MKYFLIFSTFALLSSCSLLGQKSETKIPGETLQRVFYGEPNDINNAIRAAMKTYPVKEDNLDLGIFETENLRGDKLFKAPTDDVEPSITGIRSHILLRTIKGKVDNRMAVRVVLKKTIERSRDFLSDPEPLVSDGYEENVIFYRIQRELAISRGLKRAQEKSH